MKALLLLFILLSCGKEDYRSLEEQYFSCIAEEVSIQGEWMLEEIKDYCSYTTGYVDTGG